jgi:stage II sporulation protein D
MILVNRIDLEKYIAGVVQSEVFGSSNEVEFFKIQATISRTYCLANINRHSKDGYNLCDGVHCQSYKGRCTNPDIMRGTYESFSDVVVDSNNKLISTAYHSNSGGITEDASNVWQVKVPYLRAIVDTFSIGAKNYEWKKAIPKQQWINFFISKYGDEYKNSETQEKIFTLTQDKRISKWVIGDDTIPTKNIRDYFKLRSSFFSVEMQKDTVYLYGKGYGHGVGLSQEGAIQMVKMGYTYIDILRFYYRNVHIVKYTEIIDFE